MTKFSIEPYSPADADEVLAVINDAFEVPRSADWFKWKHMDGPWGPSRGVVARDRLGMVGVRLLLPWQFELGGEPLLAYRAVEASTVARAQGQGIFSRLNRVLMEGIQEREPMSMLFSTPNQLSRSGYRKLGWTWLEPVAHSYRLTPRRRRRSQLEFATGDEALHSLRRPEHEVGTLRTAWDEGSLRWRLDLRTGFDYGVLSARRTSAEGGVAYRILDIGRQTRAILVVHRWGSSELVTASIGRIGMRARARVVLDVQSSENSPRMAIRKGKSLLTIWIPPDPAGVRTTIFDSAKWKITFADLESVL